MNLAYAISNIYHKLEKESVELCRGNEIVLRKYYNILYIENNMKVEGDNVGQCPKMTSKKFNCYCIKNGDGVMNQNAFLLKIYTIFVFDEEID